MPCIQGFHKQTQFLGFDLSKDNVNGYIEFTLNKGGASRRLYLIGFYALSKTFSATDGS